MVDVVLESNWSNVLSMSIIWSSGIAQLPRKFFRDASVDGFSLDPVVPFFSSQQTLATESIR